MQRFFVTICLALLMAACERQPMHELDAHDQSGATEASRSTGASVGTQPRPDETGAEQPGRQYGDTSRPAAEEEDPEGGMQ